MTSKEKMRIVKCVGTVDKLRKKVHGEDIDEQELPDFDNYVEPEGNLYKLSGMKPITEDSERRGTIMQTHPVKINLEPGELDDLLSEWDELMPPGQQRTVNNFIQFANNKQGVEAELLRSSGYKDIA